MAAKIGTPARMRPTSATKTTVISMINTRG
jgi:hypothetical protein